MTNKRIEELERQVKALTERLDRMPMPIYIAPPQPYPYAPYMYPWSFPIVTCATNPVDFAS